MRDAARRLREAGGSRSPRLDAELLLAQALGVDARRAVPRAGARAARADEAAEFGESAAPPPRARAGRVHPRPPRVPHHRPRGDAATCSSRAPRPRRSSTSRWRSSRTVPLAGPDPEDEPLALDVGTGSGCVALALAAEDPFVHVVATDVDPGALAVARRNAARLGLARRVEFVLSDLFDDVGERRVRPRRQQPAVHPRRRVRGARAQRARLRAAAARCTAASTGSTSTAASSPAPRCCCAPAGRWRVEVGAGQARRRGRRSSRRPARTTAPERATTSPACPRVVYARRRGAGDAAAPDGARREGPRRRPELAPAGRGRPHRAPVHARARPRGRRRQGRAQDDVALGRPAGAVQRLRPACCTRAGRCTR